MNASIVLFWLLALLITAAVVAVLVRPLLRRQERHTLAKREVNLQLLRGQLAELDSDLKAGTLSQAQYDEARQDISRRLLDDLSSDPSTAAAAPDAVDGKANRRLAAAIAALVPVLGLVAYLHWGTPAALQLLSADPDQAADGNGEVSPRKVQAIVDQLRQKLAAQPDNPQDAAMLARALNYLGKYQEAVDAYRKAVPLNPGDADLLADYADALAMTQNRTLGPDAMKLVHQALDRDPNNLKALALSASEAFQRKDFKTAISFWQRAMPGAQARDPAIARQFQADILEANRLGGGKLVDPAAVADAAAVAGAGAAAQAPAGGPATADQAAPGPGVSGRVRLAASLKDKVAPGDTVFIFTRAASGPGMPLAVLRAKVQDLPMDFHLDDSMSMVAGTRIASFPALIVGARVSKSGNAIPASGDLQGMVKDVKPGASGVDIEIAEVLP